MGNTVNPLRRKLVGVAAAGLAAVELGLIRNAGAQPVLPGAGTISRTSFGALKQINAGALDIGYAEVGPRDVPAIVLPHAVGTAGLI
jgi:hypothetical protein